MDEARRTATSKFLSLVLRHQPDIIGLKLDAAGWTFIDALLAALAAKGRALSRPELEEVVATNPKQRFALSSDGLRIRANQGHSIDVELGFEAMPPPELLYHGTVAAFIPDIFRDGLRKQQRHHVHLSADEATARLVGSRRGTPVILRVAAGGMHTAGYAFFRSENGVWLTDSVPPDFLLPD
jgi:putative RNA 2'-phosphotransferase